jgi:phosphohistidine phosphatase SixA
MMRRMRTILCLMRHGRATGQGPDAEQLPEGAAYVAALGRRLAAEGWRPQSAYTSPYLRARETARVLLAEVAPGLAPTLLEELTPETPPKEALAALVAAGLPAGRTLVVAHLPLLGLLCDELTGDDPGFHPGTLVEIELAEDGRSGRILRTLGPGSA